MEARNTNQRGLKMNKQELIEVCYNHQANDNFIYDAVTQIESDCKNFERADLEDMVVPQLEDMLSQYNKMTNQKNKEFILYFRGFYGSSGLYPIKNLIDEDIIKGIKARKKDFDGDSIDRETIRDMILKKDFSLKWNPL